MLPEEFVSNTPAPGMLQMKELVTAVFPTPALPRLHSLIIILPSLDPGGEYGSTMRDQTKFSSVLSHLRDPFHFTTLPPAWNPMVDP